ncbi:MAG: glycogen/starch synthase [Bacteroidales bacterium]|nr:glycogen/starch synthase [Bacteroidales bacterium]
MTKATKVLYITSEITPYLPETEISTISRYLPQGIQERGREIRTFMPKYGSINERRNQLHEVIRLSGMNLIIDDTDHPLIIKVASIQAARMQVYFIDNDDYFQRKATLANAEGVEFADNDERSIFFVRGVMETVKKLRWVPDIIHCHGWMTALAPLYIKKSYADDPCFRNSKVVYSVYDDDFAQNFPANFSDKLYLDGIEESDIESIKNKTLSFNDLSNLAIKYSDGLIQGSENINAEVSESIKSSGKLFLDYKNMDEYVDAYSNFYDAVWEETNK